MQEALARHDFGTVFSIARKWAGISYSRIAQACDIKPERVGILARGIGSVTSYEKIAIIADALQIPGRMVGLAPRVWESRPRGIAQAETAVISLMDGDDSVFRRDVLKTAAVGAGISLGIPLGQGRSVGLSLPGVLRERTARLRRLDNILGGGDTFRVYLHEFQATKSILRERTYSEATGRKLLAILAEQAQQAGWAAFDAGDHEKAVRLYKASQTAANEAREPLLAGNALAFLAYQQIQDDPPTAVRLATASCEAAGEAAVGSAGALLHERRAWAHAVAGNANETARALDAAEKALAARGAGQGPDWSAWVDESELQIMAGRCWTELRRPLRAVPILKAVLEGFDDTYARDKALYLSWLADSYLNAGEVEESAAVANRALDLSVGVASVRPRQQLSRVLTGLAAHSDVPEAMQALEKARG